MALAFAESFARAGRYAASVPDLLPHDRFWSELVETGDLRETAVLFVDALRFDLAEELLGRLELHPGRQVTSRLGLAALPSKTPVGMACLLPRAGVPLEVLAKNGKLRTEICARDVSGPNGRIEQLQRVVGGIEVAELGDVREAQLTGWAAARHPVVLMTRDIDDSGEIAAAVAPKVFEELVAELARWVTVLHRAGYRRVVIGTDHGFLLVPAEVSLEGMPGPGRSPEVTFSTRYAVGPLSPDDNCLAFAPDQMGRAGSARVVLPKGMATFSSAGPRHKFLHGGLSPQECLLRFLVSTTVGPPRSPVRVRIAHMPNIPGLILFVQVEVTMPSGSAQARRVRAEARSGSRVIGRSDVEEYKPPAELGPDETYHRLKVVLTESVSSVNLFLIDEDSDDELDSQLAIPSVMRREVEDDLL